MYSCDWQLSTNLNGTFVDCPFSILLAFLAFTISVTIEIRQPATRNDEFISIKKETTNRAKSAVWINDCLVHPRTCKPIFDALYCIDFRTCIRSSDDKSNKELSFKLTYCYVNYALTLLQLVPIAIARGNMLRVIANNIAARACAIRCSIKASFEAISYTGDIFNCWFRIHLVRLMNNLSTDVGMCSQLSWSYSGDISSISMDEALYIHI